MVTAGAGAGCGAGVGAGAGATTGAGAAGATLPVHANLPISPRISVRSTPTNVRILKTF